MAAARMSLHIEGMDFDETADYVRHLSTTLGAPHAPFPDDTVPLIYQTSRGIARHDRQPRGAGLVAASLRATDR
jgi:hypothetical protein